MFTRTTWQKHKEAQAALERLCRHAAVVDASSLDCVAEAFTCRRHQKSIVATLKDADISIRRRGLDLLFTMCNNQNVRDIIDELLKYLEICDFSMRDELVLKMAVLAER